MDYFNLILCNNVEIKSLQINAGQSDSTGPSFKNSLSENSEGQKQGEENVRPTFISPSNCLPL